MKAAITAFFEHCQTSLTVLHQGDRSPAAGRHKQHRTALPPDQGKLLELERLLERLGIPQGGWRGLPVRHQAGQADEGAGQDGREGRQDFYVHIINHFSISCMYVVFNM